MYKLLSIFLLIFGFVALADDKLSFNLTDKNLGDVSEQTWPDKYLYIAVGYTSCPDICPTTLLDMANVIGRLGEEANKIAPIFISIDPNRDTAEKLNDYVHYFSPAVYGLVGDWEQTQAVSEKLNATYGYTLDGEPIEPPLPARYEVFHSTYTYLYSPKRELIDVFGYGSDTAQVAQSIKEYIEEKP
ncbi:MAG: SCO family protein [Alphaproteobacteria bacterium]